MKPKYTPPLRFGIVNPNIYRGSYPTLRHFRFLRRLKLKTIISIIPEPPTADLTTFANIDNINILHINVLNKLLFLNTLIS